MEKIEKKRTPRGESHKIPTEQRGVEEKKEQKLEKQHIGRGEGRAIDPPKLKGEQCQASRYWAREPLSANL